jgi:hypothetical protein
MPSTFARDRTAGFLLIGEEYEAPPAGRYRQRVTNPVGHLCALQSLQSIEEVTMKRSFVFLVAVAMLMLSPALARAQIEQGRIIGTVTDAQGGLLPGVTVTAKSPALIGTRSTVTESDGSYRFAALPSGTYALTYTLPGFKIIVRDNIVLSVGTTLTVDMQLQLAQLSESVTVSGASPVVDMATTKVGSEFSGEKLIGIPTATDIWSTLGQAPGVRMLGFDTGGSHKSQQVGYESFGIRNQNRVVNEGVDTTEGTGAAGRRQQLQGAGEHHVRGRALRRQQP